MGAKANFPSAAIPKVPSGLCLGAPGESQPSSAGNCSGGGSGEGPPSLSLEELPSSGAFPTCVNLLKLLNPQSQPSLAFCTSESQTHPNPWLSLTQPAPTPPCSPIPGSHRSRGCATPCQPPKSFPSLSWSPGAATHHGEDPSPQQSVDGVEPRDLKDTGGKWDWREFPKPESSHSL